MILNLNLIIRSTSMDMNAEDQTKISLSAQMVVFATGRGLTMTLTGGDPLTPSADANPMNRSLRPRKLYGVKVHAK